MELKGGATANQGHNAGKSYPVVTAQKADGDVELNPEHLSRWNQPLWRSGRSGLLRDRGHRHGLHRQPFPAQPPLRLCAGCQQLTQSDRCEDKEEMGRERQAACSCLKQEKKRISIGLI